MSNADFTDCDISGANLKGTNAHIDLQTIKEKNLSVVNFEGVDLSSQDFTKCYIGGANLKGTNAHIDPQKVQGKTLDYCNLEGLDLSSADFTYCSIYGANLRDTNAFIDLNKISYSYETLKYLTKKGDLSGCRIILNDNPLINEKFELKNATILNESSIEKMIK